MFEIELPIGDGGTSYINDTSHAISENLIILAKPGQIRHPRLPFKCYYVHMVVSEGQIYDILGSLPSYIEIADTSEIKENFSFAYRKLCEWQTRGCVAFRKPCFEAYIYTCKPYKKGKNEGTAKE